MKILILGSSGFIGKRLCNRLQKGNEVIRVDRTTNLNEIIEYHYEFDFIINCISSLPDATKSDSYTSNYTVPKSVMAKIQHKTWIQIDSYFQLQIPYGRRDFYTLDKQKFCDFLNQEAFEKTDVKIKHLTLPHIFGEEDRPSRLITSVIKKLGENSSFYASHGCQYLPILYVEDALDGVIRFMQSEQTYASCPPFLNIQVYKLLEEIRSVIGRGNVVHDADQRSVDDDFPLIRFEEGVTNWTPKMKKEEFLIWVSKQAERFSY